jgi:glycosyltransferase involved in cell wall biosynthesis
MMRKKVLLIGPMPPPAGGVSVHIKRLNELLKDEFEIDFVDESKKRKAEFFNLYSLNLFGYLKKISKSDLVYIHSGKSALRIGHLVIGKLLGKKNILVFHAYPARKKWLYRKWDEFFCRFADKIILVNKNFYDRISLPASKCLVKNAFLPPVMDGEPQLPEGLSSWIKKSKQENRALLCANAWQLDVFNNQDVYGLDMCIDAVKQLKEKGYAVSFVFNVSTIEKYADQYAAYQAQIKALNISNEFLLINERLSFVRLMEQSDIVLRPTNTDGDSLTIREALFLGKPILASDVVARPPGTIIFKTRDVQDMIQKLEQLLSSLESFRAQHPKEDIREYENFYKNLIKQAV